MPLIFFQVHLELLLTPLQFIQATMHIEEDVADPITIAMPIRQIFFNLSNDLYIQKNSTKLALPHNSKSTGCSIKIQSHYFKHTSSHKRKTSKFKTKFIYYYIGFSFEVYNSPLGQLI